MPEALHIYKKEPTLCGSIPYGSHPLILSLCYKYWNPLDSVASRGAASSRTPTKGHGATTGYCRGDFFSHPDNKRNEDHREEQKPQAFFSRGAASSCTPTKSESLLCLYCSIKL